MLFLVLGKGKTGSLVAEVARERGHGVRAMDINENRGASALTAPTLAGVDVVIDFTNCRSGSRKHARGAGARLPHRRRHHRLVRAPRRDEGHRANAAAVPCSTAPTSPSACRSFSASPPSWPSSTATSSPSPRPTTPSKLDAPSGTAITLKEIIQSARPGAEVPITSHRVGDAKGEHIVTANERCGRARTAPRCPQPAGLRAGRGAREPSGSPTKSSPASGTSARSSISCELHGAVNARVTARAPPPGIN